MNPLVPTHDTVCLDHTALLALGSGNQFLSKRVVLAARSARHGLLVPALCLTAATAQRPTLADHIGGLPVLQLIDLAFSGAARTGQVIAQGVPWEFAHAVVAARPSPEWPAGSPVLTLLPDVYQGTGTRTILITGSGA